jgi:tetratricopeptide (TPR) repeat protein
MSAWKSLSRLCLALLILLGSSACALLPRAAPPLPPENLLDTPFWPQREYQCGPAALASLLNASGIKVTPDQLVPLVYLPARKGSLQTELLAAPRRFDRIAYPLPPKVAAIETAFQEQLPSLVLLNLGVSWLPIWHYAVVIGLDDKQVWLHSGEQSQRPVPREDFLKQWARAGQWAMLVTTATHIPNAVAVTDVLHSLAALEESRPALALQAYVSALQRWPEHSGLAFGYANGLLASGHAAAAHQAFAALLQHHPGSAPITNNLALAMAANGQRQQALQLLDQWIAAIPADDAWRSTLEHSRESIRQQISPVDP